MLFFLLYSNLWAFWLQAEIITVGAPSGVPRIFAHRRRGMSRSTAEEMLRRMFRTFLHITGKLAKNRGAPSSRHQLPSGMYFDDVRVLNQIKGKPEIIPTITPLSNSIITALWINFRYTLGCE